MSCQLFRPMLGVAGCKGFGQCSSDMTRFPQPLHPSLISLSCFCVSQPYLDLFPAGTARVYVWGTQRGTPKNPPQYTLKNEGIPRKAGDALWNVVSPLSAQSMVSGSSPLESRCWVCGSGSPALHMAAWLCLWSDTLASQESSG